MKHRSTEHGAPPVQRGERGGGGGGGRQLRRVEVCAGEVAPVVLPPLHPRHQRRGHGGGGHGLGGQGGNNTLHLIMPVSSYTVGGVVVVVR